MIKARMRKTAVLLVLLFAVVSSGFTLPQNTVHAQNNNTQTAPADSFYTFTPRSGSVNALVFMVDFPDVTFEDGKQESYEQVLSPGEVEQALFGEENTDSPNYPYESVRAYYERASYDKLHFEGNVFYYRAKHDRNYYDTLYHHELEDSSYGYETLMMEVLSSFKTKLNFSDYDKDSDGILDAVYLSVPLNRTQDDAVWWGNQSTWRNNPFYYIQGKSIKEYVILDEEPLDTNIMYYNQVWIHETGHLLGLPDYYHYAAEHENSQEGFTGDAGYDIMDDMLGDHNSFSKIVCGWMGKEELQIADDRHVKSSYVLKPYEESPSALIVPAGKWYGNFCSEYYLVEYNKGTKNNTNLSGSSGIRIWHVDAKLTDDWWQEGFQMFAHDQNTTESKRSLLTLMKENQHNGFFQTGESFSFKTDSGAVFHTGKNRKTPVPFTIEIGAVTDEGCTVHVIREQPGFLQLKPGKP